jgi:hypothetical protein
LVQYEARYVHLRAGVGGKTEKFKVSSGSILGAGTVSETRVQYFKDVQNQQLLV